MLLVQNMINNTSLNAHYLVLFQDPRDVSQVMTMAQQMFPKKTKYFMKSYEYATARPHGYLLIDMKQATPDILRLRSNIFPWENQDVFLDEDKYK